MSVLRRGKLSGLDFNRGSAAGSAGSNSLGSQFGKIFIGAYMQLAYNLRALQPCLILGLKCCVNILEEDVVEILITGICHQSPSIPAASGSSSVLLSDSAYAFPGGSHMVGGVITPSSPGGEGGRGLRRRSGSLDQDVIKGHPGSTPHTPVNPHRRGSGGGSGTRGNIARARSLSLTSQTSSNEGSDSTGTPRKAGRTISPTMRGSPFFSSGSAQLDYPGGWDGLPVEPLLDPKAVFLTPLPSVPGAVVTKYLGPIHLHFVKDSEITRAVSKEEGSTEQYFFGFLSEASSVARAQVQALGGNALLGYQVLMQEGGRGSSSSSGNRAGTSGLYNMVTISGDAVSLEQDPAHCRSYWDAKHSKELRQRDVWLTSDSDPQK